MKQAVETVRPPQADQPGGVELAVEEHPLHPGRFPGRRTPSVGSTSFSSGSIASTARRATDCSTCPRRPASSRRSPTQLKAHGLTSRPRLAPADRREALRPRPRVGAPAEHATAVGAERVGDLPHRPLSRQRRRSRTSWSCDSPTASSSRSGATSSSTMCRSPWPRPSASGSRAGYYEEAGADARHDAEPHDAAPRAGGHGDAHQPRTPSRSATRR